MPADPLDLEFAIEGPTPKPGQRVPATNLPAHIRRGQEEALQFGAKSMIAKGGKGGEYIPKPLIQEYNEAIERTSRITGVPPAEVVRRGIVRAEMPLYGAAGVIGVGAAAEQSGVSEDAGVAFGQGAQ